MSEREREREKKSETEREREREGERQGETERGYTIGRREENEPKSNFGIFSTCHCCTTS